MTSHCVRAGRFAKRLRGIGDAGFGPSTSLPKLVPFEGPHLLPVKPEDAVRQRWNRNVQNIFGVFGQILDAVVNQSHQRRELVGSVALAGFEDGHDTLAEDEGICDGLSHGPSSCLRFRNR